MLNNNLHQIKDNNNKNKRMKKKKNSIQRNKICMTKNSLKKWLSKYLIMLLCIFRRSGEGIILERFQGTIWRCQQKETSKKRKMKIWKMDKKEVKTKKNQTNKANNYLNNNNNNKN